MALYGLTEKDRAVIKAVVDEVRRFMVNPQSRPGAQGIDHQEHQAPEVYIAKATDTVPAMSGEEPGIGPCEIYRIIPVTGLVDRVGNLTYQVYNLSDTDIDADTWLVIQRDKFGQWVIKHAVGGASGFWALLTAKDYDTAQFITYSWVRLTDDADPESSALGYADADSEGGAGASPAYHVRNIDLPVWRHPFDPSLGPGTGTGTIVGGTGTLTDYHELSVVWLTRGAGNWYLIDTEPWIDLFRVTDESDDEGRIAYERIFNQVSGEWEDRREVRIIDPE